MFRRCTAPRATNRAVAKPKPKPAPVLEYVCHAKQPGWGVAVLVREVYDMRTYLFADGVTRTFKTAIAAQFIAPTEPPGPEDRARLERGFAAAAAAPIETNLLVQGATATPKAINLEIEAQLDMAGEDPRHWLVYADWLQAQNDPRGELIVAQAQLAADPGNAKLQKAEAALLKEHGAYFLPPNLAKLYASRRKTDAEGTSTELVWRYGFLDRIMLARRSYRQPSLEPILAELLAHPSARYLRSLTFGALDRSLDQSYVRLVEATVEAAPKRLEELVIGVSDDFVELAYTRTGDLAPLVRALPALRRLVVRTGAVRFESQFKHPELREVELVSAEVSATNLERIVAAKLPGLKSFVLEVPKLAPTTDQRDRLLVNPSFAALERLALRRTQKTSALLDAIVKAPTIATLRELDLRHGDLTGSAAVQIAQHRAKLANVKLELDGNPLGAAAIATIAEVATVSASPRTDAPRASITVQDVLERAPDTASVDAARKIALWRRWTTLGRDGTRVWGEYEGGDHYWVFAELDDDRTGCSCPSPKTPCKHALALLLLAANQHAFQERPMPDQVARRARTERARYSSGWE
jgi:uncharacterized protein (TIGR02996 family)